MSTADHDLWNRTSPYAILFFLVKIIRILMKNAVQSLAPLFALLVAYQGDLVSKLILGGILLATIIVFGAVLSWLFFRYQIRDDSILIRSGVIKKKQLDIKFSRIQGINTEQNLIYRALGLVTVAFDTAGSSGSEGNLPAVTRSFADALREKISGDDLTTIEDEETLAPTQKLLLKLDWRDMIRIALSDRRALILFAFIAPLMEQLGDRVEEVVESAIQSETLAISQLNVGTGALIIAAIIALIILIFMLFSIGAAFLRFHDFEVTLDGRTLRSRGGLLTTHEHSMDLQKIQTLRLQQGIVQVWLKRFTLTARQAISGRKQRSGKVFTIPVVTAEFADKLHPILLAPEAGRLTQNPRSERFQKISPYYMRGRILFLGLVPASLAAALMYGESGPPGLLALLWFPLMSLFAWRSWKRAGYMHDDDEIVCRSGLLGYRTVALLFRKVQRVTITQSRYQRRKNLASLRLFMASGSVRVPYIGHANARLLRDYILYRVESSQQVWH